MGYPTEPTVRCVHGRLMSQDCRWCGQTEPVAVPGWHRVKLGEHGPEVWQRDS